MVPTVLSPYANSYNYYGACFVRISGSITGYYASYSYGCKNRSPDIGYGNYGICAYLVRPSGDFNYVDNYVSDSYGNKNRYTLIEYT